MLAKPDVEAYDNPLIDVLDSRSTLGSIQRFSDSARKFEIL